MPDPIYLHPTEDGYVAFGVYSSEAFIQALERQVGKLRPYRREHKEAVRHVCWVRAPEGSEYDYVTDPDGEPNMTVEA